MEIVCITVDCADPRLVADFWNGALRWGTLEQLETEVARLEALGASIAWEEEFPPDVAASYRNVILGDVEGNEFCLSGGSAPSLAAQPTDGKTTGHSSSMS